MEATAMKFVVVLGLVLALAIADLNVAYAQCNPNRDAVNLIPCLNAAKYPNAPVSSNCCFQVRNLAQNPQCLCAAMLSNTATSAGAKPEVSVTIPKRCNIANRPVGYKCGTYTLP